MDEAYAVFIRDALDIPSAPRVCESSNTTECIFSRQVARSGERIESRHLRNHHHLASPALERTDEVGLSTWWRRLRAATDASPSPPQVRYVQGSPTPLVARAPIQTRRLAVRPEASSLEIRPAPSPLLRLSADGRVPVVGESFYQPAIFAAARGRVAHGGFENALDATAVLVPDPENPHDESAVRVDVLLEGGTATVGHLARDICAAYQKSLLLAVGRQGAGWCLAKIMGGGSRYYGVHLHLATDPETVAFTNTEPPHSHILEADLSTTVTGEEKHSDVLNPLISADASATRVIAELDWCTVERGKFAGQQTIEIRIDGRRVGQLTAAMAARYTSLVESVQASGKTPACEALVYMSNRGPQVELRMPRPKR